MSKLLAMALLGLLFWLPLQTWGSVDGVYSPIENNCEDDGGPIEITQHGDQLTFRGGFDTAEGAYYGNVSNNGMRFVHADGRCVADLSGDILYGSCRFSNEQCTFRYKRRL